MNADAPTTLPDRQPTLRVAAMPSDANYTGDIFGGWLMGQVDVAGSIPAVQRAKGRVATVAVNSFVFKQPIFVGDVVSFYARIVKTGTTSITVGSAGCAPSGVVGATLLGASSPSKAARR